MNNNIDGRIIDFMKKKNLSVNRTFSTREIADAVGLTIYQARGYLEALQSSSVVEKINAGRGRAGKWVLL